MDTVKTLQKLGGVARRKELTRAGLGSVHLGAALAKGEVVSPMPGVFALPDTAGSLLIATCAKAELACISAAAHRNLWILRQPHMVHVSVNHSRPLGERFVVHRAQSPLSMIDICVQCVSCLPELDALCILESAVVRGFVAPRELLAALAGKRNARERGVARLIDPHSQSIIETAARYHLRRAGLNPQTQVYIKGVEPDTFLELVRRGLRRPRSDVSTEGGHSTAHCPRNLNVTKPQTEMYSRRHAGFRSTQRPPDRLPNSAAAVRSVRIHPAEAGEPVVVVERRPRGEGVIVRPGGSHPNPTANFAGTGRGNIMSKNRYIARHRATPPSAMQTVSKAVSSHAGAIGRPAAVVVAASGLMLSAGLPANAAGEINVQAAPAPVAQAASAPAPGTSSHTVQAGDTLGSIAGTYGVSVEALFAANGLGWDSVIFPGDVISLSGNAGQATQVAAPAAPAPAPATQVAAPAAPAETSNLGITTASEDIQPIGAASTGGQVSSAGIAGTAQSMVGSPYVFGGTSSTAGWDCSGFVQWVYAQHGIDLPRTSQAQMGALTPTSNPQPGDLVVQNGGGHIGIYIGGGQMVSALNPSQGTLVHAVSAMPLVGYYTL